MSATRDLRLAICVVSVAFLLTGCGTGYKEVNGEWSWVTWDEGNGTRAAKLGADKKTFKILPGGGYATDKNHVYRGAFTIDAADPSTFQLLAEPDYAKDRAHVFIMNSPVLGADPATFVVLQAPYGRDAARAYCGTVPMSVADLAHFEPVRCSTGPCSGGWTTMFSRADFLFTYGEPFASLEISDQNPVVTGGSWQWARDGKYYYYGPGRVIGADYASFRIRSPFEASDASRKYTFTFPESELPARRERYLGIKPGK